MKTSIATTLSIVGVLAAGGVAFAVNTSVLDTATNQFSASQALEADLANLSSGDNGVTATDVQENPVSGQAMTDALASTPDTIAPTTNAGTLPGAETSYNISGVGVVTLSQNVNTLSVSKVAPASGYTFTSVNESVSRIEVTFRNGSKTLKFHADIIGGRIITSVLNEPAPVAGAPRPKTHDEDHDEGHEDHHEEGEGDDD